VTPVAIFSRRQKSLLIAALLGVFAMGVLAFTGLGRFMAREDPLQKADAIFVFAGKYIERPLEAADLYKDGYAPRIVVTRATLDQATFELQRRRVRIPTEYDLTAEMLEQVGVPDSALVSPRFIHDNTAEEARTLRELTLQHGWRRVIVVSSKYHLRRVSLAVRRQLRGTSSAAAATILPHQIVGGPAAVTSGCSRQKCRS
jgi:uncharacterized SAM-binding protein YcdF (DUF218 family)